MFVNLIKCISSSEEEKKRERKQLFSFAYAIIKEEEELSEWWRQRVIYVFVNWISNVIERNSFIRLLRPPYCFGSEVFFFLEENSEWQRERKREEMLLSLFLISIKTERRRRRNQRVQDTTTTTGLFPNWNVQRPTSKRNSCVLIEDMSNQSIRSKKT